MTIQQPQHMTTTTPLNTSTARNLPRISEWPWWLLIILLVGVLLVWQFATSELYSAIISRLLQGIFTTIFTTVVAFSLAIVIGLIAGLGRVSKNPVIFNIATLYVQVIRGVPILVQLLVIEIGRASCRERV